MTQEEKVTLGTRCEGPLCWPRDPVMRLRHSILLS